MIHELWTQLQEMISQVSVINKIPANVGPILYGYGVVCFLQFLKPHSRELRNNQKTLFLPLNASDVNKSQVYLSHFHAFLAT